MKKTLVVVLTLALVLAAFAGCTGGGSDKIGATIYRFDDNFMSYVRQNMTSVAEELEVPLESIDMVMGDTELCLYDAGTWGSMTTPYHDPLLRAAAAEAREALIELASEKFKLSKDKLKAERGSQRGSCQDQGRRWQGVVDLGQQQRPARA